MSNVPAKFYELCRLCLSRDGVKLPIFDEQGLKQRIRQKISACLPVNVSEDDELPGVLCVSCLEKLDSFLEFRMAASNSERALKQFLLSPQVIPQDADDLLKQIHYSTLDKGTVVEEMVVGKEETVIGSDSEETLVIKSEEESRSPSRVHQEFLKNVVEINSNRAGEANSLLRSLMSAGSTFTTTLNTSTDDSTSPTSPRPAECGRSVILMREEVLWPPSDVLTNRTNFQVTRSINGESGDENRARRKQICPLRSGSEAPPVGHRSAEAISRLLEAANYTGESGGESGGEDGNNAWGNDSIIKTNNRVNVTKRVDLSCSNCGTRTTTIWRRNPTGEMVCNACGLYYKLHNINRPANMRRDTIHTRRRRPKSASSSPRPVVKASMIQRKREVPLILPTGVILPVRRIDDSEDSPATYWTQPQAEMTYHGSEGSRVKIPLPGSSAGSGEGGGSSGGGSGGEDGCDDMLAALRRQIQPPFIIPGGNQDKPLNLVSH